MPVPSLQPIARSAAELRVPGLEEARAPESAGSGRSFGAELVNQVERLDALQHEASTQAQALATGKAEDVTSVVLAVERASLALQLAVQVRNKAVEAYQDVFRMQI